MKQIISVRGIIKKNGTALLLRRARGRDSILGKYELPGGKLRYHQQPKETLVDYITTNTGLGVQTLRLLDVCTFIDTEERDAQYIFVLYEVYCRDDNRINLSDKYSEYRWAGRRDLTRREITDSTKILLDVGMVDLPGDKSIDVTRTTKDLHYIYTDGGSRGNPGPSAAGYVIMDSNEDIITQGGRYLGEMTNDRAEYYGVLYALREAERLGLRKIELRSDSLFVVNQMNGTHKVRDTGAYDLYEQTLALVSRFDKVRFEHIGRDLNVLADGLVNKTLDAKKAN